MSFQTIKCIVVGDDGAIVGKTSLLVAYTTEQFSETHTSTTQDVYKKNQIWRTETVSLNLYDTAGDKDYDTFRRRLYKDCKVFLICFSLGHPHTFDSIKTRWLPEIRQHGPPGVPIVVCGTRKDLERKVTTAQGQQLVKEEKLAGYVECSSKTKEGLNQVMDTVIEAVLDPKKPNKCVIM